MSYSYERPLELENEMARSYLIQRLQKPWRFGGEIKMNPFSFGGGGLVNGGISKEAWEAIKNIFSFDYMGAAEFEFGAVPLALKFLVEQSIASNLEKGELKLKEGIVYYIAPKPYVEEVKKRIKDFASKKQKQFTKERVGLRRRLDENSMEKKPEYPSRICGWLELNNGYMFFTDKEMYEGCLKLFTMEA